MNRYRPILATAAALAAVLAVLLPAAPAAAHTELKSTTPAAKSIATEAVTEVTLTFSGLIKKPGTTVAVTGPDQTSYSAGDAEVLDRTITQPVSALPVGAITVAWRTAAADGHPMEGTFTFTNRAAPPTPSAEPSPTPSAEPTAVATPAATEQAEVSTAGQASDDGSGGAVVWIVVAVVAVAVALLGGLLWRRRRGTGS
ncbi:copper resistance CopC family protein [Phytohabitans kaempferiae]|uniref:Copper resistance CopC family protein n=1 Tax=Phytohabitans kaempferiae TaxID=1620943 RepID=A0ABV6M1T2_9ACTN